METVDGAEKVALPFRLFRKILTVPVVSTTAISSPSPSPSKSPAAIAAPPGVGVPLEVIAYSGATWNCCASAVAKPATKAAMIRNIKLRISCPGLIQARLSYVVSSTPGASRSPSASCSQYPERSQKWRTYCRDFPLWQPQETCIRDYPWHPFRKLILCRPCSDLES